MALDPDPVNQLGSADSQEVVADNREGSKWLIIFGLHHNTTEKDLADKFSKLGPMEKVQIIEHKESGS
jgi:hypothetical protein